MQFDSKALRAVLGCFATGVAIITSRSATRRFGVTVNSFSSVSLEPPLILFSLANTANVLPDFQSVDYFAVNFLTHEQEFLSNRFARPSSAEWPTEKVLDVRNGCPVFEDSLAYLECEKTAELEAGDHRIFLGKVTHFHNHDAGHPLLFFRGGYGTYTRDRGNQPSFAESSLSGFGVAGWS
jgi:3-hydroxy-9,10-secoandrosta-1,3,5(10)-triene-9,17-dione monooxygenase reductase component